MEVENQLKTNQDYLKKLNKVQKNKILAKKNEIKKTEKILNNQLKVKKTNAKDQIATIESSKNKEILNKINQKNIKLNEISNNFKNTQQRLEQELTQIKKKNSQQKENLNLAHFAQVKNIYDQDKDQIQLLNEKNNYKINSENQKTYDQIEKITDDNQNQLKNYSSLIDIKNVKTKDNADRLSMQEELNYRDQLESTRLFHKKTLSEMQLKNQREIKQRKTIFENKILTLDTQGNNKIHQKQTSFQQKYDHLVKNQKTLMKSLNTKVNQEINQLTDHFSKTKLKIMNQSNDPFYNISKIKPKLALNKSKDAYIVSLAIPDYEKENITLNAYDTTIKLALAKRFENKIDGKDGINYKSHKTEISTVELKTKKTVNNKLDITQKYQNGILSFKVPILA